MRNLLVDYVCILVVVYIHIAITSSLVPKIAFAIRVFLSHGVWNYFEV